MNFELEFEVLVNRVGKAVTVIYNDGSIDRVEYNTIMDPFKDLVNLVEKYLSLNKN